MLFPFWSVISAVIFFFVLHNSVNELNKKYDSYKFNSIDFIHSDLYCRVRCFKNLRFLTFKVFWVVEDSPLRFCSWDNIHWYRHWSGGFRHKSIEQYRQTSSSAQYCLGPSQKFSPHWNLYSIAFKSHKLCDITWWRLIQQKTNTPVTDFILLSAAHANMRKCTGT